MTDASRRAIRTLLQFVAAGGLTALVNELADGLPPNWKVVVQGAMLVLVTLCQNTLEDAGTIPAILKAKASDGARPLSNDPPR